MYKGAQGEVVRDEGGWGDDGYDILLIIPVVIRNNS